MGRVVGVGAPFIDYIIKVDDHFLDHIPGEKGGMLPIDYATLTKILLHADVEPFTVFGGSSSNTIKGLAHLGHSCAMIGKIGTDHAGKQFLASLQALKIESHLRSSSIPTAQVICLVTPDGERTMRAFFGASNEFTVEDITSQAFGQAQLVHIEGYRLFNRGVVRQAMKLAKEAGAKVSFDLGSFELVELFREEIIDLVSTYVDVLFGNREEAWSLTGAEPKKACELLADLCETAVVMMGNEGCYIGRDGTIQRAPAYPVEPLDTTGAGDLFASGFLHGYLSGKSLQECAHYGALTSAAVVQVLGVDIPESTWNTLLQQCS